MMMRAVGRQGRPKTRTSLAASPPQALFQSCGVQGLASAAAGVAWWAGQGQQQERTPPRRPSYASSLAWMALVMWEAGSSFRVH